MNIRQTIITATAALTMVALIAPISAGAVTVSDLQAQINALMAQLSQLQGSSSTTTTVSGNVPAACVGITFTRYLRVGMSGSDVKCMQAAMNALGYKVAASGAGSPGNETTHFGPLTLGAVRKWQMAQGWTPASQLGPLSIAKLNAWLSSLSSTTTTTTTTPGTTTTPMGAGLSVMMASNSPASSAVVKNAALVPLLTLSLHNGDNAQVKVTSLKLHRIGVSADADLSNVYLFDGANRLTDAASVSSGVVTMNDSSGLFTVDAGATRNITVYSDLAASAGETLGIALNAASDVITNASSVTGTFPINGNLMTTATATLDTVDFNTSTTPSTANVDPINDSTVWENQTSVSGTSSVKFNWIRFREIGTINYNDIQNFRLYVDGVMVGSAVKNLDSNGYVTFDLTGSPVTLQTGTRDIKVLADIIGGSNRTYSMSLRYAADANFTDAQYGAHILATANGSAFSARTTGTETINSGTIVVQKTSDSPSGNITLLANGQTLARYTLTASGEPVKIDTLTAFFASSNSCTKLRNGALFANGVQVGSTADLLTTDHDFTLGSSLIVNPGSPVTLELRSDIYCNDGTHTLASGDTITATLDAGSANGTGQVSLVTSNVPTSDIAGNQLTVKTGSLTLAKYTAYTNQTVVAPVTNLKLAHFTLNNDTVEPINITSIETDLNNVVSGYTNNLYVQYGTQKTTVIAVPSATNTQSIYYQLAPGATIDVMVFGDIKSGTAGGGIASVLIQGTTANSATAVNTNSDLVLAGQTITFGSGSFAATVDATTPLNQTVAGGQSVVAGKYKLTASSDSYTLEEAKVTISSGVSAAINSASLWDADTNTLLSTQPFNITSNTIAYFTGLNVPVAANSVKHISVSLNLAVPTADYSNDGKNAKVTLSYVKVRSGSTGTETTPTTSQAGNDVYVMRTIPTFSVIQPSTDQGTALSSGSTINLYHVNVAADAKGPIALKQMKFAVTVTDAGTPTNPYVDTLKFFRGSTDITSSVHIQTTAGVSLESTTNTVSGSDTVVVTFDTEDGIAAGQAQDYTLKGTAHSFGTSSTGNDSVSTSLAADSASSADSSLFYLTGASNTGVQSVASDTSGTGSTAENVIWSDDSAISHAYTYNASSADWFNGYEILNLPLDSTGISAK